MTLDEFQKEIDEATTQLKEKYMVALEKAVVAKLDGELCVKIVERSFEKILKE